MSNSDLHKQIVKKVLETKAVDFNALGKVVSELGPALSLADDDGINFCATMRFFIRINRIETPGFPVERLGDLNVAAREFQE
ncbi:MAG TPA: hypothetical protein VK627_01370 [Edaphobacter sp.]|nr:hypothetical protein [Edaphobacter sp.]